MNRERLNGALARAAKERVRSSRIRPDTTIASDRDGDNYIERRGSEIFFKKGDEGQWFHVYDVTITNGTIRRKPYESTEATHRVLVMPMGQWRYAFDRGEVRYITASALTRQRTAARWHASKDQHGTTP